MIQRKQSLYLLLMAIVCAVMLIADFPISSGFIDKAGQNAPYKVSVQQSVSGTPEKVNPNTGIVFSLIINGLVAIISIFAYKRLPLQLKLTAFNFLFLGLCVFFMAYSHMKLIDEVQGKLHPEKFYFTLLLPVFLMVLNILAFKGIKKDIELLASVDRLR
jgi:hypothetical protein